MIESYGCWATSPPWSIRSTWLPRTYLLQKRGVGSFTPSNTEMPLVLFSRSSSLSTWTASMGMDYSSSRIAIVLSAFGLH